MMPFLLCTGRHHRRLEINREAEEVYPLAPMPMERASESGAILESPDGT